MYKNCCLFDLTMDAPRGNYFILREHNKAEGIKISSFYFHFFCFVMFYFQIINFIDMFILSVLFLIYLSEIIVI